MPFYVAHTLARAEAIADHYLRQAGYRTLYLHYAGTYRHARRAKHAITVLKPWFPRYVFFETAPRGLAEGLYSASTARGVSEVVGVCGGPLVVPRKVIDELRERAGPGGLIDSATAIAAGLVDAAPPERLTPRHPGEAVRILDGPFARFAATVAFDNGREICLWLSIFGRSTETTLASTSVETRSPERAARSAVAP